MITYVTYAFDSLYYIANKIYIPIPITSTYVYKFSIFHLFLAIMLIGIIVFFFSHLTSFKFRLNKKKDKSVGD